MLSVLVTRIISAAASVVEYVASKREQKPKLDPKIEKLNSEALMEELEAKRKAAHEAAERLKGDKR